MARKYIKGWKKLREAAIERSGGLCEKCGIDIKAAGFRIEVNHKRSVIEDGDLESVENLETLCPPCHRLHSAAVVKRVAKTKRIIAKQNGQVRKWKKKVQSRPMNKGYRPVDWRNRDRPQGGAR